MGARSSTTISMSQATNFFNDMKNLRCDVINQCPCIPFQYAADGCYARAHEMRRRFIAEFGFDCQKIFSYGNLSAMTQIGCRQTWGWHVAPLVRIQTSSGPKDYVIDPGLFTGPVTTTTWLNKQKGSVSFYETKPGYTYRINGFRSYTYDPYYIDTDRTNNVDYTLLYGCRPWCKT